MTNIYIIDPNGKRHRIHYIPGMFGMGDYAYVRVGLFKKINQYAAGYNVIGNIIKRLENDGWKLE